MDSNNDQLEKWAITSSQYLVNDRFMKLRADTCITPQGGIVDTYYVIEYGDWVNCLAIDNDGNAIMLKHYRHGVQEYLSEFIGGGIEPDDPSPESAARRELEEEAGYTGGILYHVGTSYPNPANQTNKVHSFLAVGGMVDRDQNLEVGETIIVDKMPFQTVLKQMRDPKMVYPSMYIATMFYILHFIQSSSDPALAQLKKYI